MPRVVSRPVQAIVRPSSPDFECDTRGPAPSDTGNTANGACGFNGDCENLVLGFKRPSLYRYYLLALKLLELIVTREGKQLEGYFVCFGVDRQWKLLRWHSWSEP